MSDEMNNIKEQIKDWVLHISESESERGIFCPRCGEPIPTWRGRWEEVTPVDNEIRREPDAS